jgi:hypothetical protein
MKRTRQTCLALILLPFLILATVALVWPGTEDNQQQHQP